MLEHYFAYGSNLNENDWNSLGKRTPFKSVFRFVSRGWLPDHALGFTYDSNSRKGGVLDVVPASGCCVSGVVFQILSDEGRRQLNAKEGTPHCYEAVDVKVLSEAGTLIDATTYQVRSSRLVVPGDRAHSYVKPAPAYVDVVREGLAKFHFDETQLLAAAARKDPPPVDAFFCYGTLRKGECRAHVMRELGVIEEEPGTVCGELYRCGSFPGMKIRSNGRVHGEFVRVKELERALRVLDRIEGYAPDHPESSLFRRCYIPVRLENDTFRIAWVYEFVAEPKWEKIPGGDWLAR